VRARTRRQLCASVRAARPPAIMFPSRRSSTDDDVSAEALAVQRKLFESVVQSLESSRAETEAVKRAAARDQQRLAAVELELSELRAKHEALAADAAATAADSDRRLYAGRELAKAVSTVLLHAHTRPAFSRAVEAQAKAASSSGAPLRLQQHETLQCNFLSVADAWRQSSQHLEGLETLLENLVEPLAAVRTLISQSAGNNTDDNSLAEAEAAWRERVVRERKASTGAAPGGTACAGPACTDLASGPKLPGAAGAASPMFEVIVPEGAGPGDVLFLDVGGGEQVKVVVPEGAGPGYMLTLAL